MSKTILVTGASSGFGRAIAIRLAGLGYNLIITGRRADRLEKLTQQLQADHTFEVLSLCFDVRDNEACTKALQNLPEKFNKIELQAYKTAGDITIPTRCLLVSTNCLDIIKNSIENNNE